MSIRLVIVMNWDTDTGMVEAETFAHHFIGGIKAEGKNPGVCLRNLEHAWAAADRNQQMLNAIDSET